MNNRSRVGGAAGALVVLGLASLVAAGLAHRRGERSAESGPTVDVSAVLVAVDTVVLAVALIAAVAVTAALAWAFGSGTVPRDRSTMQMLRQTARFVLVAYLVVVLLSVFLPRLLDRSAAADAADATVAPVTAVDGIGDAAWWPLALLVWAAAGSLVVLRMVRQPPGPQDEAVAQAARHTLREAVQAVDSGGSVDDVVIAAYQRMEAAFRARGLVRGRAETTAEFVTRVIATVTLDDEAARTLSAVYERARFGEGPIDPDSRAAARAALTRLVPELDHV